ncbi:MAG TPA: sigma factor-like helix-turn-helix DNA-binding protein [Myxococcota bacterium]|jgi:hypothetical protein|nr:sigma factor-like helix-turn-helix DNA-binding protein [Myxococcota bacterium]
MDDRATYSGTANLTLIPGAAAAAPGGEREAASRGESGPGAAAAASGAAVALAIQAEPLPFKERRGRRGRRRAKTIPIKKLTREELRKHAAVLIELGDYRKPRARADCENGERPCPFVTCKYHLYLDVNPATGAIKLNFPDMEVWELKESCALDVADRGGITLEEVGEIMNLTRERIRQLEADGLKVLADATGVSLGNR